MVNRDLSGFATRDAGSEFEGSRAFSGETMDASGVGLMSGKGPEIVKLGVANDMWLLLRQSDSPRCSRQTAVAETRLAMHRRYRLAC